MGLGMRKLSLGLGSSGKAPAQPRDIGSLSQELIIPTELIGTIETAAEGTIVSVLSPPWKYLLDQLNSNPDLLTQFSSDPRAFEEFIAASYDRAGFKVTLTHRSADGGKDVIAEKSGFGAVRILDQCKAFSKGRKVGANDVRAMMGTLTLNSNASKAVITTTSCFAPKIYDEWRDFIPYRLELRDGADLMNWLKKAEPS